MPPRTNRKSILTWAKTVAMMTMIMMMIIIHDDDDDVDHDDDDGDASTSKSWEGPPGTTTPADLMQQVFKQ